MIMRNIKVTDNLLYVVDNFTNIKNEIKLTIDADTYCPIIKIMDSFYFRNDWTILAFRAFKYLMNNSSGEIKNICIIGTGSGLDAIGAIEIFSPKNILITDFPEEIVVKAKNNIQSNMRYGYDLEIKSISSLFFNNPLFNGSKYDLIYENLPNLPEELKTLFSDSDQPDNASFIPGYKQVVGEVPPEYANALLSSHYILLKQAKEHLSKDGSIISSIGGRVSFDLIEKMFAELGYGYEILVYDIKKQNEADTNLPAYSQWAKKSETNFNFYLFDTVIKQLDELKIGYDKYSGYKDNRKEVTEILEKCSLPAAQALDEFKNGKTIGHEVYLFLLKLKK